MSWDEGFLGARASRPHNAWHSLDHLPHLDQPATTPWLSFGLADAVPADRVAACSIELKLSGSQRDRMRAGRPRSQDNHSPLEGESQKPSRQAKADAVGGNRAGSGNDRVRNCGYSGLQASRFLKKSCASCASMLIIPVVHEAGGGAPSTGSTAGFALVSPTPPGGYPFRLVSFFVALHRPFSSLFQPLGVAPRITPFSFQPFANPYPTFGGTLVSLLQPLRGPSRIFVFLRG